MFKNVTQGYPVYGGVKFFVPDFNKLPYLLCSQGDNNKSDTWIVNVRYTDPLPTVDNECNGWKV